MKKFLFLLMVSTIGFAQPMSQYKYVILPSRFSAQKSAGQFGLNNLAKMFLEKNGYTVFFDTDILPSDVSNESCNKVYGDVLSDSNFRTTKLRFEVKDCRNVVLFTSAYGQSNEKDNQVAYNRALRDALKSIDKPEFKYDPTAAKTAPKVVEAVAPVKSADPVVTQPNAVTPATADKNVLNAQRIANGYQLVDTTPKIVLRLLLTSQPEVFIAETEGKNGVVVKKGGQWIFEYYKDKQLMAEPLDIKF